MDTRTINEASYLDALYSVYDDIENGASIESFSVMPSVGTEKQRATTEVLCEQADWASGITNCVMSILDDPDTGGKVIAVSGTPANMRRYIELAMFLCEQEQEAAEAEQEHADRS